MEAPQRPEITVTPSNQDQKSPEPAPSSGRSRWLRLPSLFPGSRSASSSPAREASDSSYKEIKKTYADAKKGLRAVAEKIATKDPSLNLQQLKRMLTECKIDEIQYNLLNRGEERKKKIADLAKPIKDEIARLEAEDKKEAQITLKKNNGITSETFEPLRKVHYDHTVQIKSDADVFDSEEKDFKAFKDKLESAQSCTVDTMGGYENEEFQNLVKTGEELQTKLKELNNNYAEMTLDKSYKSKKKDKIDAEYNKSKNEILNSLENNTKHKESALNYYKETVAKLQKDSAISLDKGDDENQRLYHLYKTKSLVKSDIITARCPVIVSYKTAGGESKNFTGAELLVRLLGTGNSTLETISKACTDLGLEIFGEKAIDSEKYKNILDRFPETEDQSEKKQYIVLHMLSLATQNSLNTLNTNADENGVDSRLNVQGLNGVVDFESHQVIINAETKKMGEGKATNEFKSLVTMKFDGMSQKLNPTETTIEFAGDKYPPEKIQEAFSKRSD